MNRYILFKSPFVSEDGEYAWVKNVKYGIVYENEKNYYLRRIKNNIEIEPYPISKELEYTVYIVGEIVRGVD